MRDIKFRYWWEFKGYTLTSIFTIDQIEHGVVNDFVCSDDFPAYPLTSGNEQFTGLQDRNGVDIYEGDVVQFFDKDPFYPDKPEAKGDKAIVTFRNGKFDNAWYFYGLEVIGNIHENPELLN
jgi:uncharacterized phage protein (TIGR01671 family)